MKTSEVFAVEKRDNSSTKALRNKGMTPGILYGAHTKPVMVQINSKLLASECKKAGFFSRVHEININQTEPCHVIVKEVQLHPVSDNPIHVDFQKVSKDAKIHISVPLSFINEDKAPGLKSGGTLNVVMHSIEIICPANAVPEKLEVDLFGLNINHSIHTSVLKLPEGAKISHPERDITLATIVPSSGAKDANTADNA